MRQTDLQGINAIVAVVVLLCVFQLDQPAVLAAKPSIFHVQGTISVLGKIGDSNSPGVNGAEVQFQSENHVKTVLANDKGFYEADLPFGTYTMVARLPGHPKLLEYQRPLFRVSSTSNIILNGTLYLGKPNCDVEPALKPGDPANLERSPEQVAAAIKSACGGEDFFLIPSKEEIPFRLYVRYPRRLQRDQAWLYSSDKVAVNYEIPVVVEYNLFTLLANRVVYDPVNRTLTANGNVVVVDGSGAERRCDSKAFRFENGKVIDDQ